MGGPETHDLAWSGGTLHYAGVAIHDLVCQTGTPAFVWAERRVRANLARFCAAMAFPRLHTVVYYSAKTATEPWVLALLQRLGASVEVACTRELTLALEAGFPPDRVMLDGPAHPPQAFATAIRRGTTLVKVDSLDQLRCLAEVVDTSPVRVLLRLRVDAPAWAGSLAESLISRFGLRLDDLEEAWSLIRATPSLGLEGFAVHVGSQVAGTGPYRHAASLLAEAARRSHEAGLAPRLLDLGGGFPSPTLASASLATAARTLLRRPRVPPLERYAQAVAREIARCRLPPSVQTLAFEPGRVLVGDAAVLLTRVVAVKARWAFLDASRNFVPESLVFARRSFVPTRADGPLRTWNLAGCTLSGGDVLALKVRLPRLARNDVLVMLDAGAYTVSKASRFTTCVPPAYAILESGSVTLVRPSEDDHEVA